MYTNSQLRSIFQNKYNQDDWKNILLDFFKFDGVRRDPQPLELSNTDDKGFFLGKTTTSEGLELGFFQFDLASGNVLRKRVGLRKLVEPFLKYEIDAAIAVFDDGSHWRLSFISDFGTASTAPKRFTYTFGDPTQYYNTPVNRLLALQKSTISVASLHEAFSVEALSKDFFDDYKKQYERFCDFVYEHKQDADYFGAEFAVWEDKMIRDYVKKMMGRLVFLQYLQKKGWLGNDANYLRHLFKNSPQQEDFLDKVLEPLFFGVMNTKPADRPSRFHNEGWDTNLLEEWKQVPFLSGGLFEQDKLDMPPSRFPKEYFSELFDFYARYNFTIDENDPNDAEVGVDPEMLGKIFENLLEDNKDKGAFYTPKEIVRYMSCESIIQYLKSHTDEGLHKDIENLVNRSEVTGQMLNRDNAKAVGQLLKQVKVCDPAIGSGAFPMGVLNVIYESRRTLMEQMTGETYDEPDKVKRHIIQNNIYGVDIEQGAVDIARLRFWLALVVDEKKPEELPNLDYKIMRGNSLITTFDGKYINLDSSQKHVDAQKIRDKKQKLTELQSDYYSLTGEKKMQRDIEIKCLILDLIALQVGMELRIWEEKNAQTEMFEKKSWDELKAQLPEEKRAVMEKGELIRRQLTDESISLQERLNTDLDFFDWHIMFSDIFDQNGGFDIVIGNPPYIQLQKATGRQIMDKKGKWVDEKLGDLYEGRGFETFDRSGDIYCLFYEQGHKLLRENGSLCFITSNKWMRAGYGELTRQFFTTKTNPKILIDFAGVKIFDNATVDTNILLFSKGKNLGKTQCVLTSKDEKDCLQNLSLFVEQHSVTSVFKGSDSWVILSDIERSIKKKIESVGTPLKDWDIQIYRGVLTGYNDAFIITTEKRQEILDNCQSEEERTRTAELIRPILRGRDIKRYGYNWADLWLVWVPWHFPLHLDPTIQGASERAEIEFNKQYPAVYQHLLGYKAQLIKRNKAETGIRYEWYALQRWGANYWEDFSKPKIIYPNMTKYLPFYYDDESYMTNQKCFIITGQHVAYLSAFFNSSLFKYCFRDAFPELLGGTRELSKIFFDKIPVIMVSDEQNLQFQKQVDAIQKEFTQEKAIDIDNMIFDIYQLTDIEREKIGYIEIK